MQPLLILVFLVCSCLLRLSSTQSSAADHTSDQRDGVKVLRIDEYRKLPLIEYTDFNQVCIEFGANIGNHVKKRVLFHLSGIDSLKVDVVSQFEECMKNRSSSDSNLLHLSLGNALSSSHLKEKLQILPPESYLIHSRVAGSGLLSIAIDGLPLDRNTAKNSSLDINRVHYGAVAGTYAVLELIGFAFLHPLEPFIPPILRFPRREGVAESFFIEESPFWPKRGFHIHTQHPLELTEVFQGHDIPQFGVHGPHCKRFSNTSAAFTRRKFRLQTENDTTNLSIDNHFVGNTSIHYCERWEDMMPDVDSFYEWSIANGLNLLEWLLLGNYKWGDELAIRFIRFTKLTNLGHKYSLLIGCVVPIGNIQQHGWYMVNVRLPFEEQKQQIHERIDYLFQAGYDFISTESGLSEFTHPECDLMLELFNTFASYISEKWNRFSAVKVHCSTGQTCKQYLDPRSYDPVNFNFLPHFAHPSLGVYPHTVQVYAFDDPTSGTYGNQNFSYIEDYLVYEAQQGRRDVLYYGETSYWVNVDIDVPLFLPIYGQRRQRDLRKIAIREHFDSFRLTGQMNFDSGWEYGYWLNNLVTARSSWNPQVTAENIESFRDCRSVSTQEDDITSTTTTTTTSTITAETATSTCSPYADEWEVYANSIGAYTSIYGPHFGPRLTELLVELSRMQIHLLIDSLINNRKNPNIKKLSGIAYLSGSDTWSELPRLFGLSFTQPDKVALKESDDEDWPYVLELLTEMSTQFQRISQRFSFLHHEILTAVTRREFAYDPDQPTKSFVINEQALAFLDEIRDSIQLLALRARQVQLLYESNDADLPAGSKRRNSLLQESRGILSEAQTIVQRRESFYRVAWQRIAAWRDNPTVYRFGYLWAVHSLFYWWRDQGVAETLNKNQEHSPCYLNRMDSTEVVVGWGKYTLELLRYFLHNYTPFSSTFPLELINCLSPPTREYEFPRDL